jgi:RNA polymerase sigma-70 factor, ECF subfamily
VTTSSEAAERIAPQPRNELGLASSPRPLEALVRQHLAHVYRLLRQLGVPASDTDDATQQVFWTLSRRLQDVAPGSERAFLSAAAVRVASRWRRTHRRRREDESAAPLSQRPDIAPSPEVQLQSAQAERLLLRVLGAIPDKLREVFVLFEIEELTLREISVTLDIPQGTAASRLRLARERFRCAIEELGLSAKVRRAP